jgi:hypothetical protein
LQLEVDDTNGDAHIRFITRIGPPASLADGQMWCTSTNLYIRLGGTTYTIDKT